MKIPRKKLTLADYYLIAANLVPLYGVWFLQWKAWEVFAVYSLETIIIGLLTIVKMAMATAVRKKDVWENNGRKTMVSGVFFILFFLVHYGMFVAIQLGLFFSLSGMLDKPGGGLLDFLLHPQRYLSTEALLMLLAFALGYSVKMLTEFVLSGKHRTTPMMVLMIEPYSRIIVQQVTVIAGSFVLLFGAGKVFILVFTAAKIYVSVVINFDSYVDKLVQRATLRKAAVHTRDTALKD